MNGLDLVIVQGTGSGGGVGQAGAGGGTQLSPGFVVRGAVDLILGCAFHSLPADLDLTGGCHIAQGNYRLGQITSAGNHLTGVGFVAVGIHCHHVVVIQRSGGGGSIGQTGAGGGLQQAPVLVVRGTVDLILGCTFNSAPGQLDLTCGCHIGCLRHRCFRSYRLTAHGSPGNNAAVLLHHIRSPGSIIRGVIYSNG